MRWTFGVLAILLVGCSESKLPTSPTFVPVVVTPATPTPTSFTLSGTVSATNGNQPLSSLTVSISGYAPAQTSNTGAFSLTLPPLISLYRVGLSGAGILERQTTVEVTNGKTVNLDVIREDGTFDLTFYRQFVRNSLASPSGFQPLRRQRESPRIYLRTITDTGERIDGVTIDAVAAALINTAGQLTGRFGLAALEQGVDTREGQPGWITVRWLAARDGNTCGTAAVGGDLITLYANTPGCQCGGTRTRPATVKHELGHTLGFWHTDSRTDLMFASGAECDKQPSARERYHAAIAYSRPIGNIDPDVDPLSAVSLAPMTIRH